MVVQCGQGPAAFRRGRADFGRKRRRAVIFNQRGFTMKNRSKDIIVIGFALFAMFFGAGNMIFPPKLGLETGSQWALGFASFTFADAGLALLTILALIRGTGSFEHLARRAGRFPAAFLGLCVFLCVGPLMAIPRTAASTFELGVAPIFHTEGRVLFSIFFFAVAFVLAARPSKVIDIIGKFLTPALYVALLVMIFQGILHPMGRPEAAAGAAEVFATGIKAGYQTMDVFGAVIFNVLVASALAQRRYQGKEALKTAAWAGLVAVVGLTVVYGGLAYLGACASGVYDKSIGQSQLLLSVMETIMGRSGVVLLGIVVALACLTTAVGLTSAAASYFSGLTRGKVGEVPFAAAICVFSAAVSNAGIDSIVAFSAPVLTVIYPAVLTLIALSFFDEKIKNDWVVRLATLGALVASLLKALSNWVPALGFIVCRWTAWISAGWRLPSCAACWGC